jgi:ribosomal protein S18 acetylase RimI-like enzyme
MSIVDFEPRHAEAWRTLNEAWISRWFTIEAKDRKALDDPQGAILSRGGRIFMAEQDGAAVGCVALIPLADGGYEVAKMTVSEAARGTGLGKRLMQHCVDAARAAGAPRLYLETNSQLAPALALYRAFGFRELDPTPTDYARCNVWMELPL